MLIAKYKFDNTLYDLIPEFNSGYTDYTYTDEIDGNIVTRTIECDTLPTLMRFGSNKSSSDYVAGNELALLEVLDMNTSALTTIYRMFRYCENLTSIICDWDTSKVTTMSAMFQNCSQLTSLDLSEFDTSKVTNMSNMFQNCANLTSLDLSGFETANVTSMANMFQNCNKLTSLDLSEFETSNVTSMANMFRGCSGLTSLDVSNWDTSSVTNMQQLFYNCTNLTSLDLSEFDTAKVTNMVAMFYNCNKLTSLDLSGFDTSNVTDMGYMFQDATLLANISGISSWDTSQVTTMSCMFMNCNKLTSLDLSGWETSKVTDMANMFNGCTNLTSLDLSNWDVGKVISADSMFKNCTTLTVVNLEGWAFHGITINSSYGLAQMFQACTSLTEVKGVNNLLPNDSAIVRLDDMFQGCANLTTLDLSNWNTSNVTNMSYMFYGCSGLTSLDVSNWDTSSVTNMQQLFYNCTNLTSLDVSNWNTSKVTNMHQLFYNCTNLTSLDVSNWNTSNVTNMNAMFYNCHSLITLDVSKWNTDKVSSMRQMFSDCQSLIKMDFSNWVIYGDNWDLFSFLSNCINLEEVVVGAWNIDHGLITQSMFYNCPKLKHIYGLGTWNTSGMLSTYALFQECSSLVELDISNWDLSAVTNWNGMLLDMDSLKYIKCNNINTINILTSHLPVNSTQGTIVCKQRDLSDLDMATLNSKNWTVVNEPILVAKYVFDKSIYNNTIPTFNTEFEGYFIEDVEIEGNEVTRTIESCGMLPTKIRFSTCLLNGQGLDGREKALLELLYINISNLTTEAQMFQSCINLTYVNTENMINLHQTNHMFCNCNNLTSLDVSNFNTSNVTNMAYMFQYCTDLTTLDVSNFDTSNVTDMYAMFQYCTDLTTLDVSNFDTSNVTDMYAMFSNCTNLTTLDVSNFNTSKITNMNSIFNNCKNLTSLDVSNWNASNVTTATNMFNNTPLLTDIGVLYMDKSSLQKLVNAMPTDSNKTLWYKDVDIDGITHGDNITLKKYKEENVEIVLNSPLLKGDTIEVVDGKLYHYHKMGKRVLDGSESWKLGTEGTNDTYPRFYYIPSNSSFKLNGSVMSDKFSYGGTRMSDYNGEGIGSQDNHAISIRILDIKLNSSDPNGFVEWLSENPVTAIYELANPYYEDITPYQSSIALRTFNECNIQIITALPIKTKITYRTNITSAYELERQVNSVDTSGVSLANLIEEEVDE